MGSVDAAVLGLVGVLGLFIGSFLNVVVYRVPRACLSVWRQARSRCPRCGVQLRWFDNVPVLSWLVFLRGRCFACGSAISMRYPLVEIGTATAFVALFVLDVSGPTGGASLDQAGPWLVWGVHALVVSALIALSLIDIDFRILPDSITLPGIVLGPLLMALVPEAMPDQPWRPFGPEVGGLSRLDAFTNASVWAAGSFALLWGLGWAASRAFRKPAMGLGDVKLFAGMGGLLGVWVLLALLIACFAGAIVGIGVLLVKRDRYVPFGPFLAIGTVATMLKGPAILDELTRLVIES